MPRRVRLRLRVLLATTLALIGTASAGNLRLGPNDLATLERLAAAIREAPPSTLPAVIMKALADLELDHPETCRAALREIDTAADDARAVAALHVAEVCKLKCFEDVGRAVTAAGALRASRAIVEACDRAGRDTIFVGPLERFREEMEPGHYVLLRHALADVHAALDRDGGDRGRAIWTEITKQLPALAATLVRIERALHAPAPDAAATPMKDTAPSGERAAKRRMGPPLVLVAASGAMTVDGADADRTAPPAAADDASWRLAPLVQRLDRWRSAFAARRPSAPPMRRAIVRADATVPFSALKRVLYTLRAAGFPDADLAVPAHDPSFRVVRWSGHPDAPLVVAIAPEPARLEWDEEEGVTPPPTNATIVATPPPPPPPPLAAPPGSAMMRVHADGVSLARRSGVAQRIDDVDEAPDEASIRKTLQWLRKTHPSSMGVEVADDVPYRRLLLALDAALRGGFDTITLLAHPATEAAAAAPSLAPGDEPPTTTATRTTTVSIEQPEATGGLDPFLIARIARLHLAELRFCHEQAQRREPVAAGLVVLALSVDPTGAVKAASVKRSASGSTVLDQCFATAPRRWQFPRALSGAPTEIALPIRLR